MNSKKSKLLRKYGKVDKRTKRMYNSLSADEKGLITDIYEFNIKRRKTIEKK